METYFVVQVPYTKKDLHRGKGRPAPHKRKTCATEKKFLRN